jgi:hypothetical protein
VSKRSPLIISPAKTQRKISVVVFGGKRSQSIPAVPEQIWSNNESSRPPKTPSPSSPSLQSYASLPSLVEISENIPFMECKRKYLFEPYLLVICFQSVISIVFVKLPTKTKPWGYLYFHMVRRTRITLTKVLP